MDAPADLRRRLGTGDAVAIFVGIIVGSGIFRAPSAVAAAAPGLAAGLLFWIAGGLVTACGAFCYAECGVRLPQTGGFYVFYRETYGPSVAFVGGWIALFVTYPASVAAIALIFSQYLAEALPFTAGWERSAGIGVIVLASLLNVVGVRVGAWAQRILTSAKVVALGGVCAAALFAGRSLPRPPAPEEVAAGAPWAAMIAAMVAVLWTYDGWSDVTLVSGEIRNPARNLRRAVLAGTAILVVLYALVQVAVWALLPPEVAARSGRVVADAVNAGLGGRAGTIVALLVVLSTFGSINAIVLAVSRLGFAMARDGAFVRWFGGIHPRWETPARATAALAAASVAYVLRSDFQNLLNYFTFSVWIFYALTAVALLRLRRLGVGAASARSALGAAIAPAVVIGTAACMTSGLLVQNTRGSLYGLAMIGAGFAAYGVWRRTTRPRVGSVSGSPPTSPTARSR